jgi:intracellular sulfur oxidation DsrE/DsrF family protein
VRLAATAGTALAAAIQHEAAAQDATPAARAVPPDFKVVLHAAQADHWVYVRSNVRNLQAEWPQARVRVVVDGNAVSALAGESDLTAALSDAIAKGLELYICPNALREHGIPAAEVRLDADLELGGVIALVLAHQEGFVYVKP